MSDVEIEILYNYYLGEIVTKLDEIWSCVVVNVPIEDAVRVRRNGETFRRRYTL